MRYNERISINTQLASDEHIMQAFHQIDLARAEISLSYFEFGTLAALLCIKQADVDVAVLEVGLGGRLDAVNIIDADLVHFTPIGIDHTAWLGDTRELIAVEKAGVLRQQCLVVCNDEHAPKSLVSKIESHAKKALTINAGYKLKNESFYYAKTAIDMSSLALMGHHQKLNCCGVLAGLMLLNEGRYFNQAAIESSFKTAFIKGRFETIESNKLYKVVVDVGHNVDAAQVLAQQLRQEAAHRCVMILGMLDDKNVTEFSAVLAQNVDHCICIDLHGDRALSADELSVKIQSPKMSKEKAVNMAEALAKAKDYLASSCDENAVSEPLNIILVTGSFYTVEACINQY